MTRRIPHGDFLSLLSDNAIYHGPVGNFTVGEKYFI